MALIERFSDKGAVGGDLHRWSFLLCVEGWLGFGAGLKSLLRGWERWEGRLCGWCGRGRGKEGRKEGTGGLYLMLATGWRGEKKM